MQVTTSHDYFIILKMSFNFMLHRNGTISKKNTVRLVSLISFV